MPSSSKSGDTPPKRPERRRNPREYAKSLVYVELGDNNGGIALNFSESGISVQAANAVSEEIVPAIRFQLPHSHLWIQTAGRVVWTSESQTLVAIEFVGLSEKSLEQIRQWLDFESKIDLNSGLAPASANLPVEPRSSPKVASALASMLSHDPAFTKMEDELLEPSEVSTYTPPVPPRPPQPPAVTEPPAPVAEIHVEPAVPPPATPVKEELFQTPPKHVIAERERTRFYEPPARVFPGSALSRSKEEWKSGKCREVTPAIPIDPEVEKAQEEIRQIIASGEQERSRSVLGRLQNTTAKRPTEKRQDAPPSARQPASPIAGTPAPQKNRTRDSAFSRTAVRIDLQKPEREIFKPGSPESPKRNSWTLPVLLGILVALLGVLLWLGARGSVASLFRNGAGAAQDISSSQQAQPPQAKDFQIEVVDAKGRRRTIPAAPTASQSPQKTASPVQ